MDLSGAVNAPLVDSQATGTIRERRGGDDFNGDGKTDLVWRHAVSGQNVVWFINGVNQITGTFTNPSTFPDTNWQIVGTNDFNSDAKADFLWRHVVSGENVVWFMNGVNLITGTFLTPSALADVDWRMVGTGDFNQDSKPDILWQHGVSGETCCGT